MTEEEVCAACGEPRSEHPPAKVVKGGHLFYKQPTSDWYSITIRFRVEGGVPLPQDLDTIAAHATTQIDEPVVAWDDSGNELVPVWDTRDSEYEIRHGGQTLEFVQGPDEWRWTPIDKVNRGRSQ